MKTDRLIGILSILLQEEKTTAPELAEKFEVSRRTINRDIEDLCKAGIPIRTAQGTGGGISIMDGYRMDRTILTSKDMQMILAGLRSLDSVSGNRYYGQLMEKGFKACDEADNGIQLWYLPFEEKTEPPVFKDCAKHHHINESGYVLYYTNQCPFNAKYVPILEETAQKNGIPLKAVKIENRKDAQNVPTPITTYALFCDGEYVTNEQMNDKKFLKLVGR